VRVVRQLVPKAVRHGISAQLARVQAVGIERDLDAIARGTHTIVAGPWLGEVGFELLYWVPFLRWFTERYQVDPARMLVVSRGGTSSWYSPFAAGYREIFDYLSPAEFRQRHHERVAANGEQKQTRILAFEHNLLQQFTPDVRNRAMLHPATMYRLFRPFWWGHVDESWVHRFTRYQRFKAPDRAGSDAGESVHDGRSIPQDRPYVALKFYFNDCFPATDTDLAFVRQMMQACAERGPVVSLTTGLNIDDHGGAHAPDSRISEALRDVDPRSNLLVQSAVVAGASRFVGTYGGFSYLAPFYGVPSTAYYADPLGFSARHLLMARSALAVLGTPDLLDVRQADACVTIPWVTE
jgi:hypothetical protein